MSKIKKEKKERERYFSETTKKKRRRNEEEETKSRARGDSFETLRLSRCAALLCLHKEARKRKRKKEGTRTTLTPLSRPHTHTLDIYYLAPSSCEQLLAVAFVHPASSSSTTCTCKGHHGSSAVLQEAVQGLAYYYGDVQARRTDVHRNTKKHTQRTLLPKQKIHRP